MASLLALPLAAGDIPRTSPAVEQTFTLSELTPAQAAELQGRRARFRIALDSAEEQAGTITTCDCLAPDGLAAGVWL
jgi:hypothetical protein